MRRLETRGLIRHKNIILPVKEIPLGRYVEFMAILFPQWHFLYQ